MTATYELRCSRCGEPHGTGDCACRPAQNPVARLDLDALSPERFLASLSGTDLWRYEALLPVPRSRASRLRVGGTPLLDLGVDEVGVRLLAKDETRSPSGSLKDRATEVALAVAAEQGHERVVGASTGNAGASLACVAAARGMAAKVVVPAAAPRSKLAQIEAYGAELIAIDGSYDDAFDAALDIAAREHSFCRNTGVNPYVREGKKTCALEIAEQLGWSAPDWVVVPCGDGNLLAGIGTGFLELARLGVIAAPPRLVAAQARTSDSIARTFAIAVREGEIPAVPEPAEPTTRADSIAVGRPRDHVGAIRALLECGGLPAVVDDAEIIAARRHLARRFGLWVEPAAAAGFAALGALRGAGTVVAGETVVLILSGAGLKDPVG